MRRREFTALLGGAALGWPLAARSQQAVSLVGLLGSASPRGATLFTAAVRQGLSDTDFVEGRNLTIEYRWAEDHYDRLPALAADLVGRKVDVIVTQGGPPAAIAAKRATSTIPIVFHTGADPVADGLVASLARPSGNLTGFNLLTVELTAKRLELLLELVPKATVIALLANPRGLYAERIVPVAQDSARAKGVQLHVLQAASEAEIDAAFSTIAQVRAGGLLVGGDPFFSSRRDQLVEQSSLHGVPAIYDWRGYTASGGLISYGVNFTSIYRQVGIYTGRILKGANPADLPVEQPTKFDLGINLRTAKALGLTVPPALLARADEVIE
jgi:putative tryptophan/tyrosine transport system substrate-binding protein